MTAQDLRAHFSRALAGLLCALSGGAAWAQQDTPAETQPSPPATVADTAGTWWAKLYEPEFLSRMVLAATEILTVIIITAVVYVVAMLLFRRAAARIERDTQLAVQPHRRRKQRIVTVIELVRSIAKWVILITGGVWVLASAGMDIRPVLAGAGYLAVRGLTVDIGPVHSHEAEDASEGDYWLSRCLVDWGLEV